LDGEINQHKPKHSLCFITARKKHNVFNGKKIKTLWAFGLQKEKQTNMTNLTPYDSGIEFQHRAEIPFMA
jgi:hypothetical protein